MSQKLKRDVPKRCSECKGVFYVTKRDNRKKFCKPVCRERYHSKASYAKYREWRIRHERQNSQQTEGGG
jgi:ribosomal protein L33